MRNSKTCPNVPACGYRHAKPNTPCDLRLPGKVRRSPPKGSEKRTVAEIRREVKAVFAPQPRPYVVRPRGKTLVKATTKNPAHATDLLAPEEITVFVPMKDQPTGERYSKVVTGLGARNLARRAA